MEFGYNIYDDSQADVDGNAHGPGDIYDSVPRLTRTSSTADGELTGEWFKIESDSPCRDNGTSISSVTEDYFGAFRPEGSATDIGAHEYGSTSGASGSAGAADAGGLSGAGGIAGAVGSGGTGGTGDAAGSGDAGGFDGVSGDSIGGEADSSSGGTGVAGTASVSIVSEIDESADSSDAYEGGCGCRTNPVTPTRRSLQWIAITLCLLLARRRCLSTQKKSALGDRARLR